MSSTSCSIQRIKFCKIDKAAVIPRRQTTGAAGYDLHSIENVCIGPQESVIIRTGLFILLRPEIFGMIFSRSGLSYKNGIEVKNSYVVDRKEIVITVVNNTNIPFVVESGMRVAQLVFIKKDERRFNRVGSS
ncbi:deoxyuridine 5_triP nucleotidohydrolase [Enterospora canceri]|uniref:Deoxyuridine 5'-triphosphate nucleotidohydrolase n=1 Tax=Enterospora canceri TaxID=1081671 RepID=A0A1Y1S7F5_9MICR|nr:deoxyuridine 5_triP nucleotidohydrolase [Enterospora canceri]